MRIVSTAFFAFFQTGAKLVAGLIIVKVIAILAGPEGIASFGVFQNLCTILLMLSGGVASTGVTKVISQAGKEYTPTYRASARFTLYLGVLSACLVLPILLVSQAIFLGGSENEIYLFAMAGPLVFVQSRFNFNLAVLNGLEQIRDLATKNILSSMVSIFSALVAYFIFRRWEIAALATVLGSAVVVVFSHSGAMAAVKSLSDDMKIDRKLLKTLVMYSVVGGVSAISVPMAQIFIRDFITVSISDTAAGIWQGITRLSEVYLVLISSALSIYIVPKIAAAVGKKQILQIVGVSLAFAATSAFIATIFIFQFKDLIVHLIFDQRFYQMGSLFIHQLPGDFLKVISWVFAFTLLARGNLKTIVFLEVVSCLFYVLLAKLLIARDGVDGAVVAYTMSYALYLFLTAVAFWRTLKTA